MNFVSIQKDDIPYSVCEEMEALAIVMLLSPNYSKKYPFLFTQHSFQYLDDLKTHFYRYSNHKILSDFDALERNGFSFHKPMEALLSNNSQYTGFISPLMNFSNEIGFNSFFAEQKSKIEEIITFNVKQLNFIKNMDYSNIITNYFGDNSKKLYVLFGLTFGRVWGIKSQATPLLIAY